MISTEKQLYVHEAGSVTNPAIVFLHGSPLSGRMWLPQLDRLTEFHCLAPDLPEHGQSAGIGPFTMEDTVARLAHLIRNSTPNGRAHIVGLSFGGVVAQAMMVQAPEVVDHVILSGTAARFGKALLAAMKVYLYLNKPVLALLRPDQLSALMMAQFGIPAQYRSLLGEDMKRVPASALVRFILATYAEIVTPPVARTPVLVIAGQKETPVAKVMARRLRETIAGSRGTMVPGGGHVWNLQFPDLFTEVVRAWVTDQPLSGQLLPL
jgi:pimeloyl-ACP methyl ester carboxylesterase